MDPLRYQQPAPLSDASGSDELMTVKLRYKQPDGDTSRLVVTTVRDVSAPASENARFAAAVAEFGVLLRDPEQKAASSWARVRELAEGAGTATTGASRLRARSSGLTRAGRPGSSPPS